MLTAILILALALAGWGVLTFNRLVRSRNLVGTGWADIDVQLKRRHDLVPQLVAAVKGYAGHERSLLTAVTELRAQAIALSSPTRLSAVEDAMEQTLGRIVALKEDYPDLKANQNFLQLQRDLVEVEDHLQYARRFYNGAVRDYNTAIQRFPAMLIAHAGGFQEAEFFRATDEERDRISVQLTS